LFQPIDFKLAMVVILGVFNSLLEETVVNLSIAEEESSN